MIVLPHASLADLARDAAVIFDRDGTLIRDVGSHISQRDEIELFPTVRKLAPALAELNVPVALVSNQAGVGRGQSTTVQMVDLHNYVVHLLSCAGIVVHLSVLCPHTDEDGCECRKPLPGMLLEVHRRIEVDAQYCYVIGDAVRDMNAAVCAGMIPMLVRTGHGVTAELEISPSLVPPCSIADDVGGAMGLVHRHVMRRRSGVGV